MNRFEPSEIRQVLSLNLANSKRTVMRVDGFQQAAVLVPLIDSGAECTLLFTKRTETVDTHKGQVSFPGGVVDGTDTDPTQTALREACEEVGIIPDSVETLGILDDITTPIGFVITPVVGFLASIPNIVPNGAEVAEAFQIPLSFFADPRNGRKEQHVSGGRRYEVWSYNTGRHVIWGATAKIVRMLLDKMKP